MCFEHFYHKHSPMIRRLAWEFSRSCPSLYDDYFSVMSERLWRVYEQGHRDAGLVFVALKRAAIDLYRSYRRSQARSATISLGFDYELPDNDNIEAAVLNKVIVESALSECAGAEKAMAVAFYRGESIREIAGRYGLHHEYIRRKFQRIGKRLFAS